MTTSLADCSLPTGAAFSEDGTVATGQSFTHPLLAQALRKLVLFVVLALPLACAVVAASFALPLAAAEDWAYVDAFIVVAQELSGATMDLTPNVAAPTQNIGRVISGVISLVSLGFFAVILGVLGGSLVDPVYLLFTLHADARNPKLRVLIFLFVGLPATAAGLSVLCAVLLSFLEGWAFQDSFYALFTELTTTNIQLGNTVTPSTLAAKVLVITVALWSLALFAIALGVLGGPLAARAIHFDDTKERSKSTCALMIFLFSTVVLPGLCLLSSFVFAVLLSTLEQWPFGDTFWLVLASLSATNVPLTQANLAPQGVFASFVCGYTGLVGVAIFSIALIVAGGELLVPFIVPLGLANHTCFKRALAAMMTIIFVAMPILSWAVSAIFGAMLMVVEGWEWEDSFFAVYASATACQIGIVELDEVITTTVIGKLLIVNINLWTLAIFAAVVGLIAGKVARPILTTLKLDLVEAATADLEPGVASDKATSVEASEAVRRATSSGSTDVSGNGGPVIFEMSTTLLASLHPAILGKQSAAAVEDAQQAAPTDNAAGPEVSAELAEGGGLAKPLSRTGSSAPPSTAATEVPLATTPAGDPDDSSVGNPAADGPAAQPEAGPGPRDAADGNSPPHVTPPAHEELEVVEEHAEEGTPQSTFAAPHVADLSTDLDERLVQLWFEEHTSVMNHPVTGRTIPEEGESNCDETVGTGDAEEAGAEASDAEASDAEAAGPEASDAEAKPEQ